MQPKSMVVEVTLGAVDINLRHDRELCTPGLRKLLHLCVAARLLASNLQGQQRPPQQPCHHI